MRVTPQHWEVFIEVCEKHPNLITGKFNGAQAKAEGHNLCKNVTIKLNGLGLREKSETEWRRAVTDWKSKVKAKASKLTQSALQTRVGPLTDTALTPLEKRLISIMGKKGFEGDEGILELGLSSAPTQANQSNPNNEVQIQEQTYQNKRKHEENHETIREEHNYCEDENVKKGKRLKTQNISRVSKNLEEMTSESLDILKNIDQNTGRIATAVERIADVLVKMIKD